MGDDERRERREDEVIRLLEDCQRLLPPPFPTPVKFALSRFAEQVRRRELEKAWDAMFEAGEALAPPRIFWRTLEAAAAKLGLEERRAEAAREGKA